ncbi:MAG: superoxide dismutase [Parachlamydiaceae bacterium]|nr:superoxide dismutase [Parachlamydiaceae bacterium]
MLSSTLFQSLSAAESMPKETSSNPSFVTQPKYEVKNFDHLIGNISGLDDALLKMHFKLYEGYVNNTNIILQKLQLLNSTGQNKTPEFAALKRLVGWEFDGMLLHEYYFENLGGKSPLDSKDPLALKMNQDFGSFEQWKADFIATGLMRGIGWVVAYIEPKNGRLVNEWINEHDLGHLAGGTPILIMDVFEHAYITQFALDRAKYIDVFFANINWDAASRRFNKKPH